MGEAKLPRGSKAPPIAEKVFALFASYTNFSRLSVILPKYQMIEAYSNGKMK